MPEMQIARVVAYADTKRLIIHFYQNGKIRDIFEPRPAIPHIGTPTTLLKVGGLGGRSETSGERSFQGTALALSQVCRRLPDL